MKRSILAVIVGYIALLIVSAALFTGAYFAVGIEAAFKPRSFEISRLMALCGIAVGVLAGVVGAIVCQAVSRSAKANLALVAITFAITLATGIPMLTRETTLQNRLEHIGRIEAMTRALHPHWFTLLFPVAQAAGVWAVASRRRARISDRSQAVT